MTSNDNTEAIRLYQRLLGWTGSTSGAMRSRAPWRSSPRSPTPAITASRSGTKSCSRRRSNLARTWLWFPFGMPWIPFLALGLTIVGSYWLQFQKRQQRLLGALAAIAMGIGFDFSVIDSYGFETMPFVLFKQGKGRKAQNVMTGTHNGLPLAMFDYEYYVQGRNREYHRFTCAVLTIPAVCPALCITSLKQNLKKVKIYWLLMFCKQFSNYHTG